MCNEEHAGCIQSFRVILNLEPVIDMLQCALAVVGTVWQVVLPRFFATYGYWDDGGRLIKQELVARAGRR